MRDRRYGQPVSDAAAYRAASPTTAAVVRAGDPDAEIAMIGRPPVTLGALESAKATLSRNTAPLSHRRAAAEMLIASTHTEFRVIGAKWFERNIG